MSYLTWMSFLSYNIITSITPGPMNIIAMNVAGNQGVRGGRSIYAGLILGLTVVILLCGLFSSTLVAILPNLIQYMRFIGSAYIMWIAWVILRSRPESVDGQSTELNFNRAFLLQFINVKAYIWAITVYSLYVLPTKPSISIIVAFAGLMLFIAVLCAMIWAFFGVILSSFLQKYWRAANVIMAVMLFYSAINLLSPL